MLAGIHDFHDFAANSEQNLRQRALSAAKSKRFAGKDPIYGVERPHIRCGCGKTCGEAKLRVSRYWLRDHMSQSFEACELSGASETALPVGTALGINTC